MTARTKVATIPTQSDRARQIAGSPLPRGAAWDGKGVNFSLFSECSESVELCLFDPDGTNERRIRIRERTAGAWHIYVPNIAPGQLYGYRVHGPYDPDKGLRCNPNKLLLDPYAKAIGRRLEWADELFGYTLGDPNGDLSFDDRDSAAFAPLAAVVDSRFGSAEGDTRHVCGRRFGTDHQTPAGIGHHGHRVDARTSFSG